MKTKVKYREILQSKKETDRDALDKLIEECPDEISPVETDKCVSNKVYDENEKNDEEKEENETTYSERTTFDEVKEVNDERGGEGVALVEE